MDYRIKDRSGKLKARKERMPKNGIAFRNHLVEQRAQAEKAGAVAR